MGLKIVDISVCSQRFATVLNVFNVLLKYSLTFFFYICAAYGVRSDYNDD